MSLKQGYNKVRDQVLNQVRRHPKRTFAILAAIIAIIIVIIVVPIVLTRPKETFTARKKETFGYSYEHIGNGPLIDAAKVNKWLASTPGGKTDFKDGKDVTIQITNDRFRAIYGFIPPSFVFYPKGQNANNYNNNNPDEGRADCQAACSLTDCVAVQTEVPANCSQQQSDNPDLANNCGNNSEFSCTLFYNNITEADDGYWKLTENNPSGCIRDNISGSCMGKKYYEDSAIPKKLPSTVLPSISTVKFCGNTVPDPTKTSPPTTYGVVNPGTTCSCTGSTCNDPNCCVYRDLLTTEFISKRKPYYNLPVDVIKAKDGISSSVIVPSISNSACCGLCPEGGGMKLKSCTGEVCTDSTDTNGCWRIATDTSACSGNILDKTDSINALNNYKSAGATEHEIHATLFKDCFYKQKGTAKVTAQFNCPNGSLVKGCWGSPPILYTETLSPGDYGACNDNRIIPNSMRCQYDPDHLAECVNFPYNCDSADNTDSTNSTNNLWLRS